MADTTHILVVIDPTQTQHPSLDALMALANEAPQAMRITFLLMASDQTRKNLDLTYLTCSANWVRDNIYQPLNDLGHQFDVLISWSRDWSETLIDLERELEIDVTMIPYYDSVGAEILSDENWKLLRQSRRPVLISRHKVEGFKRRILAAVNFQDERFEERNSRVISAAHRLTKNFGLDLHVVNAYSDSMHFPDRARIAAAADVANDRVHVQIGEPADVINAVANEINASLVIVSSHKRTGLQGLLRGNTVEKIVADVSQDILMV